MNTDCCMKVVELEILRKTLLNCSHASEFALRREGYEEVLKLDEQVFIVFMKTITSHPYGHKSLWLPIKGVLFQLTTCIVNDIWGVVIFESVHDDFK